MNSIKQEISKIEALRNATFVPSDEEIAMALIANNGNMNKVAQKFGVHVRIISAKIKASSSLVDVKELAMTNVVESINDLMSRAILHGFIPTYKDDGNGNFIKTDKEVDTGTRLFHAGNIIKLNKKRLGIDTEPTVVNNNVVNVNVLTAEQLAQIEQIIPIDDFQ